jgi:hypothetical protein
MALVQTYSECMIALHRLKQAVRTLDLAVTAHTLMPLKPQCRVVAAHSASVITQVLQRNQPTVCKQASARPPMSTWVLG